ncbi:MAG: hypothetical protein IJ676_03000 [Clostridia bacterium]|nr:hypothetical protein [Clostridia bacterium]
MAKIDLNEKLSKKTSTIIVLAIVLFVIVGIIVAVAAHSTYIKGREAKIVKVSASPIKDGLYATKTPSYLGYNYSDGVKTIDLSKIVSVSKGATLSVKKVLTKDLKPVSGTVLDIANGQGYLVSVSVTSDGNYRKNDYVIQIESEHTLIEGPEIDENEVEFKPIIKE